MDRLAVPQHQVQGRAYHLWAGGPGSICCIQWAFLFITFWSWSQSTIRSITQSHCITGILSLEKSRNSKQHLKVFADIHSSVRDPQALQAAIKVLVSHITMMRRINLEARSIRCVQGKSCVSVYCTSILFVHFKIPTALKDWNIRSVIDTLSAATVAVLKVIYMKHGWACFTSPQSQAYLLYW